ncbi:MAG: CbbQ/NirQ/NorQ/GpvN family protein [Sandaracinaceae bacterium]|nr:CbbQ/NirQ/NorQ/GpvN family protein [Sandaracinaceae bacterium]
MADGAPGRTSAAPYYRTVGSERDVFRRACGERLPVLLKGPTGCGKSRLVEAVAHELGRPLVTVACNDETSAADLLGRWLVRGGETVWQDGPVTRAVRTGAILYLDEVAEAREDVIVVLHPLADHRRELFVDRHDETILAPAGFQLVASFNPGYRRGPKDLKPSTRQRFVAIAMRYPEAAIETEIVATESGCETSVAKRLVSFANKVRELHEAGLAETASTRLLVAAARLVKAGVPPRTACRAAIVEPLTDDPSTAEALGDLADLAF